MMSKHATIRAAEERDAPAIAAMMRELAVYEGTESDVSFSVEQLRAGLSGHPPKLKVLLAEDEDGLAGFASYTIDFAIWTGGDVLRVDDVFISEHRRRHGIGRALMRRIASIAVAAGMAARWEVEVGNVNAQQFYRGLGVELREKLVARWSREAMKGQLQQE